MKYYLEKTLSGEIFSEQEAEDFIHSIAQEDFHPEVLTAILVGLELRGVNLQELKGFRNALLNYVLIPEIEVEDAIDLCGTGGDGKNTFNISTTTSMVLAAMGKKVVKHGNFGVSSICGSSNVIADLGFKFETDSNALQASLDKYNFCYLHAPLFHPVLKKVANVRKIMGVRTIFNSLGPLINPVQPEYQLTGTYSLALAKNYNYILKECRKNYAVLHGLDGYDELSLTDVTRKFSSVDDSVISAYSIKEDVLQPIEIRGGKDVKESGAILQSIIKGQATEAHHKVVAINTAVGLQLYEQETALQDLYNEALAFIKSGQTAKFFKLN